MPEWQKDLRVIKEIFHQMNQSLDIVAGGVCEHCAVGDPLFCEVMEGQYTHRNGLCKASPLRVLQSHVDDTRHQFANEWNLEWEPRAVWSFQNTGPIKPERKDEISAIGGEAAVCEACETKINPFEVYTTGRKDVLCAFCYAQKTGQSHG